MSICWLYGCWCETMDYLGWGEVVPGDSLECPTRPLDATETPDSPIGGILRYGPF